jgi:hypothetical protein
VSPARERLAALATAAGYGTDALSMIADAALPRHIAGERLGETAIAHVASAVEVLAQCGYSADALTHIIAHYRDRYGERRWREFFWQRQLRTAALRFNHPRFYGLSPSETDPARLAGGGPDPADPAHALPAASPARAA